MTIFNQPLAVKQIISNSKRETRFIHRNGLLTLNFHFINEFIGKMILERNNQCSKTSLKEIWLFIQTQFMST